jgi:hypothetical protein
MRSEEGAHQARSVCRSERTLNLPEDERARNLEIQVMRHPPIPEGTPSILLSSSMKRRLVERKLRPRNKVIGMKNEGGKQLESA